MKSIELKAGTFQYDDRFIPLVTAAIKDGKTGMLFNPYDNCFIFMDSIKAVEETAGQMTDRNSIK